MWFLTLHCTRCSQFSHRLVYDIESDTPNQYRTLWPKCLWGYFQNEFHWPAQFFLECPVYTRLAFQSPGWCLGQQHKAQGRSSTILWLLLQWSAHRTCLGWFGKDDVINLPGLSILIFYHYFPHLRALPTWPDWLQGTFHNYGQSGRYCPCFSPPLSHEPIWMLHLFPNDLRCHGPTQPEIIHPYVARSTWDTLILATQPACPLWCSSLTQLLGARASHDVLIQPTSLPEQQCLATIQ